MARQHRVQTETDLGLRHAELVEKEAGLGARQGLADATAHPTLISVAQVDIELPI